MSVICLSCEGWGCASCKSERDASRGGEQGLSPLEIETQQLREKVSAFEELVPKLVAAMREDFCSRCLRLHANARTRGHCPGCDALRDAEALLAGRPA